MTNSQSKEINKNMESEVMNNKKFLGEIIKEHHIEIEDNTMVIAPAGSGKTHYILNDLCKGKKALYVCDNNSLKQQVYNDTELATFYNEVRVGKFVKNPITLLTYSKLGEILHDNHNYLDSFEVAVFDEIHNLFAYHDFNYDENLKICIDRIFNEDTTAFKIFFTATPYYYDEYTKKHPSIKVRQLDFTKNEYKNEINKYIERNILPFQSWQQIPELVSRFIQGVEYRGLKVMIYTDHITTMKSIEECLSKFEQLNCISIWSPKNLEHPMNEEQKEAREMLLATGKIPEKYNVLIINKSLETGINIFDKNFEYVIVNSNNPTTQVQARNRVRQDVFLYSLRVPRKKVCIDDFRIELESQWLDSPLTKTDKDVLVNVLNLYDAKGRQCKWNAIKDKLIKQGYEVADKTKRIDGKKTRVTVITK